MKMIKIEKRVVNSKRHAQKNLELVERLFNRIDLRNTIQVLEIGCGVGIVSAHLTNRYNMNVVGIDLDSEQIAIAKMYNKENEHLKFIEADSTKLPFGDHEFDMVLSIYVREKSHACLIKAIRTLYLNKGLSQSIYKGCSAYLLQAKPEFGWEKLFRLCECTSSHKGLPLF